MDRGACLYRFGAEDAVPVAAVVGAAECGCSGRPTRAAALFPEAPDFE